VRRILRIQRAREIRFGRASICKSNAQRETRCKTQSMHNSSHIDYEVLLKAPAFRFVVRFQRATDSQKQCIKSNAEFISQNPTQNGFRRIQRGADFAESNAEWISHNPPQGSSASVGTAAFSTSSSIQQHSLGRHIW